MGEEKKLLLANATSSLFLKLLSEGSQQKQYRRIVAECFRRDFLGRTRNKLFRLFILMTVLQSGSQAVSHQLKDLALESNHHQNAIFQKHVRGIEPVLATIYTVATLTELEENVINTFQIWVSLQHSLIYLIIIYIQIKIIIYTCICFYILIYVHILYRCKHFFRSTPDLQA